jgi:hypothetical protein
MPGPLAYGAVMGGSALLNMFAGNAAAGRMEKLREQLMEMLSSRNLGAETNDIFGMMRNSPMYTGLRTRAMEGSSALAGQLQTSYARRGLSNTGLAATALPIARSGFTRNFQDIDANMFAQALQMARSLIGARAGVLQGTSGPSGTELGIGNTLQSIMPLLLMLLQGNKGGGTGGAEPMGSRMGQPGFAWK